MTNKYYLLTFNEDYADEHNVPALACMSEEKYLEWLEKPSGKITSKYEEQLKKYQDQEQLNKDFWKMLESKGYTLNGSGNTSMIPKNDYETLKLEAEYRKATSYENRVKYPKKVKSFMSAYLGNSGDGFDENYSHLYLFKEFVENNIVKVLEVNEDFYNLFHKGNLSYLSLCNIFDDDYDECYYDEDDE
jgi:hypothetical protein